MPSYTYTTSPTYTTLSSPLLTHPTFWLPESPVHDSRTNKTWFTDIPASAIYTFTPGEPHSLKKIKVDDLVGCIALIVEDETKLLVGGKRGVAMLDIPTTSTSSSSSPSEEEDLVVSLKYITTMFTPEENDESGICATKQEKFRINDGSVDSRGRFWLGSMRSFGLGPPQFEGALWRFDGKQSGKKQMEIMRSNVGVPNGVGWSLDDKYMYFTDTKLNTIFRYKYDAETGNISDPEEWVKFVEEVHGPGSPDGLDIDSNGDLWVAVFNGNKVLHLDGVTGEIKGKIVIPSSKQIACPRFIPGGLLITTGKLVHMDPEIGKSHSLDAGSVFFAKSEEIGGAMGRGVNIVKLK